MLRKRLLYTIVDTIRNHDYNFNHDIVLMKCCWSVIAMECQYLSVRQTAEKWGLSPRRVQILCSESRIPGAQRIDTTWAIPVNAAKPSDARVKSGKYRKGK